MIFAIETSCDETSTAIVDFKGKILSHIVTNQEEHRKFGGVVPELASRAHLQILQNIIPKTIKPQKTSACISPGQKRSLITRSCKKTSRNTRHNLGTILSKDRDPIPFNTIHIRRRTSYIKDPMAIKIPARRIMFSLIEKCISFKILSILK